MADIEEKLRQLEDTINETESAMHQEKANMPNSKGDAEAESGGKSCIPYMYIIGGLIPVITAIALYCAKPKFVTKKVKGKQTVDMKSLFMYTAGITIVGLIILYIANCAMNGSLSSVMACFGGNGTASE